MTNFDRLIYFFWRGGKKNAWARARARHFFWPPRQKRKQPSNGGPGIGHGVFILLAENIEKQTQKSKLLGVARDALGGIGGSSLSNFGGFSKDFEKVKIRKIKIWSKPV